MRFIEYKSGQLILGPAPELHTDQSTPIPINKGRNVPLKLRLRVLKRDNFKCVLCGRSPAIVPGISLHIDHKIPFSRGGETVFENLQTLCQDCNLGKGAENIGV